jgi:hypothetical protein
MLTQERLKSLQQRRKPHGAYIQEFLESQAENAYTRAQMTDSSDC